MSAEDWSALFSGAAVVVTIVLATFTYIQNRNAAESRNAWELDQDTKRQGWAKDLQDRQNEWQEQRDAELQAWEEEWRKKQEEWHEQSINPQLRITMLVGPRPGQKGQSDPYVLSYAQNTGMLPVRFKEVGSFVLPDGKVILQPTMSHHTQSGASFDPTSPDYSLAPGASVFTWWRQDYLLNEISRNGYMGELELRARFVDQIDGVYESDPLQFAVHAPLAPF